MRFLICLIYLLIVSNLASAQEKQNIYRIKSGSDISRVMPFADQFQYEEFLDGKAYYKGGRTSLAKFNYSFVQGEVMFLAPQKDTLLLTEPDFIDRVIIGEHLFYYKRGLGHVEMVGEYGKLQLGKKQFLIKLGNEKYAAYDQYSSTSSISSYSSFTNQGGRTSALEGQDKIILKRRSIYFLVDNNRRFSPANRSSIMKFFPSRKVEISSFLKENNINLEIEQDLIRTLEFCSTI